MALCAFENGDLASFIAVDCLVALIIVVDLFNSRGTCIFLFNSHIRYCNELIITEIVDVLSFVMCTVRWNSYC